MPNLSSLADRALPPHRLPAAGHHPTLQHAGLDLAVEVSPLLSTLQSLMEAFPAPDPATVAASVDEAPSLHDRTAPPPLLDTLTMATLIARAWCGLALWAVSEGSSGPAATRGAEATPTEDATAGDASSAGKGGNETRRKDDGDGDGGGEGEGEGDTNLAKTGGHEAGALSVVLGWLLLVDEQKGGVSPTVVADSGSAFGGEEAVALASRRSGLARWKMALLAALIRALSRLRHCFRAQQEDQEERDEDTTSRLHETVVLLSPFSRPRSSHAPGDEDGAGGATGSACPECVISEDVRNLILREGGGDAGRGDGSVDGVSDHAVQSRTSPIWLVLLVEVLGRSCCCRTPAPSTPSATDCQDRGEREGSDRPECVPSGNGQGGGPRGYEAVPALHRFDTKLPESVLSEVLGLSPRGSPSRVLACLASAAVARLEVGRRGGNLDETAVRGQPSGRWESCLNAIVRLWGAEVRRQVWRWRKFRRFSAGTDVAYRESSSTRRALGLPERSVASAPGPRGAAEAQLEAKILLETANTLRFLLKTAWALLSRLPLKAPGSTASATAVRPGAGRDGGVEGTPGSESGAIGWAGVGSAAQARETGAVFAGSVVDSRDISGRRGRVMLDAVSGVYGAHAAALWRSLFAVRQRHPSGFPTLLKKLAKDCAVLALSTRTEPTPGSSSARISQNAASSQVPSVVDRVGRGWGVVYSQTQPSQRDPRESYAGALAEMGQPKTDGCSCGQELAAPPPSALLPLLTVATVALLQTCMHHAEFTTRPHVWRGGLASLAWLLTSTTPKQLATYPAGEQGSVDRAVDDVCALGGCVNAVHSAVAAAARGRPGRDFPTDEESLAPLSRFLGVGISRSCAAGRASHGKGRRSCATAEVERSSLWSNPSLGDDIRALTVCVLSAVRGFPSRVLTSPGVLRAVSPMLEAVLDMPRSRCASALQ